MNSKVLVWSYLLVLSFATIFNLYIPKNEAVAKDSIVIPGEAVRLRILANSDSGEDQAIKRMVRDAVNAQITLWVQDLTSLDKAKEVIKSKLPEIQVIAEEVVASQGSDQSVKVEFGNVQFPTKLYGQFLYPAGEYQAVLITLGEGTGANWWCVLYPPLCFLDFSNGVAVSDGFEEKTAFAAAVEETTDEEVTTEETKKQETVVKDEVVEEEVEKEVVVEVEEKEEEETPVVVSKKQKLEVEEAKLPKVVAEVEKEKPAKSEVKKDKKEKTAPVYTEEDEEPVKVKFFVVEMFETMFN